MTQRPQWFLKEVFNMKNKWKMRFRDSGENICTWFSSLGVLRIWLYIERSGKCKILPKNNTMNQITKCVNRFRQIKTSKLIYEDWYELNNIWIKSQCRKWRLIWFKELELIQQGKKQDQKKPVIQIKPNMIRFMNDTIHQFMNRLKMHKTDGMMAKPLHMIRFKTFRIESNN
jgi:hypothetical protein